MDLTDSITHEDISNFMEKNNGNIKDLLKYLILMENKENCWKKVWRVDPKINTNLPLLPAHRSKDRDLKDKCYKFFIDYVENNASTTEKEEMKTFIPWSEFFHRDFVDRVLLPKIQSSYLIMNRFCQNFDEADEFLQKMDKNEREYFSGDSTDSSESSEEENRNKSRHKRKNKRLLKKMEVLHTKYYDLKRIIKHKEQKIKQLQSQLLKSHEDVKRLVKFASCQNNPDVDREDTASPLHKLDPLAHIDTD